MKNRIMSVVIALLLAFVAISANAVTIPSNAVKGQLVSVHVEHVQAGVPEVPMVHPSNKTAAMVKNLTADDGIEFPANLLPDVQVYNSGFRLYASLTVPLPPTDSSVTFAHKAEVYLSSSVSGSIFAYLKTIPMVEETVHERYWFKVFREDHLDANSQLGDVLAPGDNDVRVKVYYTTGGGESLALVYDFYFEFGSVVFWAQPCLSGSLVGLDVFVETLFPGNLVGEHLSFQIEDLVVGYGTLEANEYSYGGEWPLYTNLLIASTEGYDENFVDTSRELAVTLFGETAIIEQGFYGPSEFLPTCGEGGGKGKKG